MIQPMMSADELLANYREADNAEDSLHVWWLGQSGFLLKWNGSGLLFDPYLSDSLTRKYERTDKPHERMTEIPIDPHKLDVLGVVTSSHNHTDHLDSETLLPLTTANPRLQLVLPAANEEFAAKRLGPLGPKMTTIDAGESTQVGPWTFHGINAAHNEIEHDEKGRSKFLGFVVTFGNFTVYHSGDTLWHDDLVHEIRQHGNIDLAMLPINGNRPERRVAGNLNGLQAAALAKAIGAAKVVPCHYDMFTFNTETPDEFVAACNRLDQNHQVLQCGQRLTIAPTSMPETDK